MATVPPFAVAQHVGAARVRLDLVMGGKADQVVVVEVPVTVLTCETSSKVMGMVAPKLMINPC